MRIKTFKEFSLNEEAPFDGYSGPSIVTTASDLINYLQPGDDPNTKYGYGFSFPYDQNGPYITRWSGDGTGQLGIRGGSNGGKIGAEFDHDYYPGSEIKRDISNDEVSNINQGKRRNIKKEKILKFLQLLNKK